MRDHQNIAHSGASAHSNKTRCCTQTLGTPWPSLARSVQGHPVRQQLGREVPATRSSLGSSFANSCERSRFQDSYTRVVPTSVPCGPAWNSYPHTRAHKPPVLLRFSIPRPSPAPSWSPDAIHGVQEAINVCDRRHACRFVPPAPSPSSGCNSWPHSPHA